MQSDVTLSDIAEKLGVSSVTVSKALAGKKGVSDELREEILSLADKMGYVRKEKNHHSKKNTVIGVIVAERYLNHSRSFYWHIYKELSVQSNDKRILTLLEVINREAEESESVPNLIAQESVDGLIILGAFNVGYLRMLRNKAKIPMLSLDSLYEEIEGDAVITDNILGGYEITRYLFDKGHRKIGFVGTLKVTPSIDERYIGMCKFLSSAGLDVEFRDNPLVINDRDKYGNLDAEGTFALPSAKEMPTAFFCNCDVSAILLIEHLKEKGYKVPKDISVIGFDNYVPDMNKSIELSSYEIDLSVMISKAMELLTQRLRNPDMPFSSAMIRGKLIVGDSVRAV